MKDGLREWEHERVNELDSGKIREWNSDVVKGRVRKWKNVRVK